MYCFIPIQLVLRWYIGLAHLVEQLQLNFGTPDFWHFSSLLEAANNAVRELGIYTNEILVTRLSICAVYSHRFGVEEEGTHKHFG